MDDRKLDISREFDGARLGDARLDRRLSQVGVAMAEEPARSFPEALPPSDLEAAYRLFRNGRVGLHKAIGPHQEQTKLRASELSEVVVAHDTSEFRFNGTTRRNLGTLGTSGRGFLAHVALAVAPQRSEPLGVLHVEAWTRTKVSVSERRRRGELTDAEAGRSEERESLRWARGVDEVERKFRDGPSVVHVMDSEADNYMLLSKLQQSHHRFVIRLGHERAIEHEGEKKCVRAHAEETTVVAERDVYASPRQRPVGGKNKRRKERSSRTARLSISAASVHLLKPKKVAAKDAPKKLDLNVVYVRELAMPAGADPIEWTLLTTDPIEGADDLLRIVDYYRLRWLIEEYFKALKTGCAMEARQLESLETLLVAFGIFIPIAWALLRLRALARAPDSVPARDVLTPMQLHVLAQHQRSKLISDKPTAQDALLAVARLGGHLKRNGDPGWIVLCRGYSTLLQLEEGYRLASGTRCDQS
jgi:hypothetical protein